jgi:2-amino-4-hydroxy-6-hydroxymethyldihydropteridine diphosphokinase
MTGARPRWRPAYIGVGSNLDEPAAQVLAALDCLAALPDTRLVGRSGLYRSRPLDQTEQPDFINAVAALLTMLGAQELLAALQCIEREQGRVPSDVRWGPRVLDLDLLVYSNVTIDAPQLSIPHPGIAARNFVLLPLREIAPELQVPQLGRVAAIPVDRDKPHIVRID